MNNDPPRSAQVKRQPSNPDCPPCHDHEVRDRLLTLELQYQQQEAKLLELKSQTVSLREQIENQTGSLREQLERVEETMNATVESMDFNRRETSELAKKAIGAVESIPSVVIASFKRAKDGSPAGDEETPGLRSGELELKGPLNLFKIRGRDQFPGVVGLVLLFGLIWLLGRYHTEVSRYFEQQNHSVPTVPSLQPR